MKNQNKCAIIVFREQSCYGVADLHFMIHRMGVVQMDKKSFDFKDLMAFGMFIVALLTFIFMFVK